MIEVPRRWSNRILLPKETSVLLYHWSGVQVGTLRRSHSGRGWSRNAWWPTDSARNECCISRLTSPLQGCLSSPEMPLACAQPMNHTLWTSSWAHFPSMATSALSYFSVFVCPGYTAVNSSCTGRSGAQTLAAAADPGSIYCWPRASIANASPSRYGECCMQAEMYNLCRRHMAHRMHAEQQTRHWVSTEQLCGLRQSVSVGVSRLLSGMMAQPQACRCQTCAVAPPCGRPFYGRATSRHRWQSSPWHRWLHPLEMPVRQPHYASSAARMAVRRTRQT